MLETKINIKCEMPWFVVGLFGAPHMFHHGAYNNIIRNKGWSSFNTEEKIAIFENKVWNKIGSIYRISFQMEVSSCDMKTFKYALE